MSGVILFSNDFKLYYILFNRVVKRLWDSKEVSCKKQTNKFIYQKSDMFVANIESLIV